MHCIFCGKVLDNNSDYCIYCGSKQPPTSQKPPNSNGNYQSKKIERKGPSIIRKLINRFAIVFILLILGLILFLTWPFISILMNGPEYDCSYKEGVIDITNQYDIDAMVRLYDRNKKEIQELMVKAHSTDKMRKLCKGRYHLDYEMDNEIFRIDDPFDITEGKDIILVLNSESGNVHSERIGNTTD